MNRNKQKNDEETIPEDAEKENINYETDEENGTENNQLYELRKAGRLSQMDRRIPLTGWQKIKWGRNSR